MLAQCVEQERRDTTELSQLFSFCRENDCVCKYETPQDPTVETNIENILTKISAIEKHLGLGPEMSSDIVLSEPAPAKDPSQFPYLTIKDSGFAALIFPTDFNFSTRARSLESQSPMAQKSNGSVAIFHHSPHELVQLYLRVTHTIGIRY